MAYTRSFEDYAPPARYDGLPFTEVDIRESATETGTYSVLETIALSPTDSDPENPALRNFTTALATEAEGWYVIRWRDDAGATFDSDAVQYLTGATDATATKAKLSRMVDADTEPTLSATELNDLLNYAARTDASGYTRSDSEWTPTWDLNAGAAEGWRRKAGKAASRYSFAEDGQQFQRSHVYGHCLRQAEHYARTESNVAVVSTTVSDD